MTVTVTDLIAGPFTPTGVAQVLPFGFMVFTPSEIEAYQILAGTETPIDPGDMTVSISRDSEGIVVEGGSVTLTADVGGGPIYLRAVPSAEQGQVWSDFGSRLKNLNEALDRAALRDLALSREAAGKISLPTTGLEAGGYVAVDADGNTVFASGTGSDPALRSDLATPTGALLVGTSLGGSVQSTLDRLELYLARQARDYPPWANGEYYGDLWPTAFADTSVAVARLAANLILARVYHDGIVDEFVWKDPEGEGSDGGVAAGWQLVSWRGFASGRVKLWLEQPQPGGSRTILEFAIRILNLALYTYNSNGESNQGAYRGYGHGGLAIGPADPQIILNGGGPNLQSVAAFPVGTRLYGSSLNIVCPFRAKFYNTATEAVSISTSVLLNKDEGMSELLTWGALIANVGWQDSYVPMHGINQRSGANRAKLGGTVPAITLVGETNPALAQKGNWHTTAPAPVMQFYDAADPTIVATCRVVYGPPLRKNDGDIAPPWALNRLGRVHVTDNEDFAKFRCFVASSEEVEPRTAWPMLVGDTYTALTRRRTEVMPGGPV